MRYRLRTLLILLAVLSVYLASYRALMRPKFHATLPPNERLLVFTKKPGYRFIEPVTGAVFWPLALIDQTLRPGYWDDLTEPKLR